MRIRYLAEGVFKTPGQARAAREKEKAMNNVDKISSLSSNIITAQVQNKLNEFMTCFDLNKWYDDNDMEKASRFIYNNIRVAVSAFIRDLIYYNGYQKKTSTQAEIEFRTKTEGAKVLFDIYITPSDIVYKLFSSPVKTLLRVNMSPIRTTNPYYHRDRLEENLIGYIEQAAKYDAEHNSAANGQASRYILEKIQEGNLKFNKIHLFENSKADYQFILDYSEHLAKEVLSAQSFMNGLCKIKEVFSFDNEGTNVIIATDRYAEKERILLSLDKVAEMMGDDTVYDVLFEYIDYISNYNNLDNSYSSNPKDRRDYYNEYFAPYAKSFKENAKKNPEYFNRLKFYAIVKPTKYAFDITSEPKQIDTIPCLMRTGFALSSYEGKIYDNTLMYSSGWSTSAEAEEMFNFTRSSSDTPFGDESKVTTFTSTFDMFILGLYLKTGLRYGSKKLTDKERETSLMGQWNFAKKVKQVNSYCTSTLFDNNSIIKKLNNVVRCIENAYAVKPKRLAKPLLTTPTV